MSERPLLPLSPAEKALIFAFREMIREGRADAVNGETPDTTTTPVPQPGTGTELCRVPGRNGICVKPRGHGQRHRYGNPPPVRVSAPVRNWEKINNFQLTSGSRKYLIEVGKPVKVKPKPIGSPSQDGWRVVGIERHTETGQVNVSVSHQGDPRTRIVPSEQIIYKRT